MKLLKSKFVSSFLIFTLLVAFSGMLPILYANAASISPASDTMSREQISTASTQVIKFTVGTTMVAGQNITVTWPSGFTFTSPVFGDVSMTYGSTGTNTSATIAASASSGQTFGASFGGTTVLTINVPTSSWTTPIIATNIVIITIASTHEINPSSAGSNTISIATSAGDAGSVAVPIVLGSTNSENETITATVAPTITFANSNNTAGFGTLSSASATYANSGGTGSASDATAHTLTIVTNAPTGYTLTYNGANLTSGSNTIPSGNGTTTITSSATGTTGSSQFAISATAPATGTIAAGYQNVGSSSDNWKFVPSTATTLASSTGPVASDAIAMHYLANISGTTPSGSYSTTITYIATGNF